MKTIFEEIKKDKIKETEILKKAGKIISQGGLVAFPTETVYGLGGDALNSEAAARIYSAKGRPSDNPLIIHISDVEQLKKITSEIDKKSQLLIKEFWPGPLTIIFNKNENVPYSTTGGLDTVAVRMPDNEIALKVIEYSGTVIAAPSANTSGRPSPTNGKRVAEDLDGKIDMIIDAGNVDIGLESTIIDMTENIPAILRPGAITQEMIEKIIGEVRSEESPVKDDEAPKAPGMKYRHYAPKAKITMFNGDIEKVVEKIKNKSIEDINSGLKVGIIASAETGSRYTNGIVLSPGRRNDDEEIAKNLYEILRKFDDLEVDCIYAETFEKGQLSKAIMNRFLKAAAYNIIKV